MDTKKYDTKKYCKKYYDKMKGGTIYNNIIAKNSFNYMLNRYKTKEEREKYLEILKIKNPDRYNLVKKYYDNYLEYTILE